MRTLFFLSTWALLWFAGNSCSDGNGQIPVEKVEATDNYGNLEVYARRKSNYAKEGLFKRLTPQGATMEEAYYRNDTLNGVRILYYEQGDTQSVEHYQMGLYHGPYRSYYPSGPLQQEGQYDTNEMTGTWKQYYENSQLREVVQFEQSLENGPFVEYYENGQLKAEGQYSNGAYEHGELKLYNEAGELVRIMDCSQGVCNTRWKAEES